ncbi:hypothetical protein M408DRAFT_325861 [Serendipita vermifera MAFF 305830]|uniref:Steroid 5-alpha reductase C-terminal domain-containing protein n=1 Tax=Serendipita vermifera MAFF 305830 TaxID=933852 RepID=A0A0C3BQU0_SERVB|nr:hypothetical protein M408DRAFT_325861 [Serendipita vermifera MAFF 305830]
MPTVFSKLWPAVIASYSVQVAAASIFVPLKTEKYYDLLGATGHLVSATVSIYGPSIYKHFKAGGSLMAYRLPPLASFAPRQLVITLALSIWAARLGTFLFHRITNAGSDSRFDKIKQQPLRFFTAWVIQGTWVSLIGLPVWLTNAVPVSQTRAWGRLDTAIIAFTALSLGAEILADRQKSIWRQEQKEGKHQEKFITSGLWSISRHPNYVAEIAFQTSLFALACRSLVVPGIPAAAVGLAATSPLFTYFILRYVSGVPMLEKAAKKKWGDDPAWKQYTRTTPVFFPWAPIYD